MTLSPASNESSSLSLARLRLARRPPLSVPVCTAFPVTLTLSDDLGVSLCLPSLTSASSSAMSASSHLSVVRVQCIDPSTSAVSSSYTVINASTKSSMLEISSHQGDFHSFSLLIQPLTATKKKTEIELRFTPIGDSAVEEKELAHFLDEREPAIVDGYFILSVRVAFTVTARGVASTEKGASGEPAASL